MADQQSLDSNVRNIVIVGNTGREIVIDERIQGFSSTGEVVYKTKILGLEGEYDPGAQNFEKVNLVLFVFDSGRLTEVKQENIDIMLNRLH